MPPLTSRCPYRADNHAVAVCQLEIDRTNGCECHCRSAIHQSENDPATAPIALLFDRKAISSAWGSGDSCDDTVHVGDRQKSRRWQGKAMLGVDKLQHDRRFRDISSAKSIVLITRYN